MPDSSLQWQIHAPVDLPDGFIQAVQQATGGLPAPHLAQILWQRGLRETDALAGFLQADAYQPTSPSAFGEEMEWAIARLQQARQQGEFVAIWGDFDADGITATAVLWEGLGQFFPQHQQLVYHIPNRLTESHGLAIAPLQALADQGCRLIVTCDTGSNNRVEIDYANALGIDLIITDHHTLPAERPPVCAIINPRALPIGHPLSNLSGVAVAYKLVEALYEALPEVPKQPLDSLLDLVAIGLIADLVELTGDCRYLAQRGIERLQWNQTQNPPPRPGVARLLELCKRSGDRPTDISFGLGPRINAISRIHGDARFGVELLTSKDGDRCRQLAEETELANTRRKALQKDVAQQVKSRLAHLDLSTTSVIVLEDPQWSVGVLGLVAGQIAQEYGRPTILLSSEEQVGEAARQRGRGDEGDGGDEGDEGEGVSQLLKANSQLLKANSQLLTANSQLLTQNSPLARGSARSVNQIDLYQLVQDQKHLLSSFGGHPYAAGLSLPTENIPLFAEAINRQLRQQELSGGLSASRAIQADVVVTVAELGKDLFRELKFLEPCGIGNPPPKLLIRDCWFKEVWNRNIQDWRGRKIRYIKTEFTLWDESVRVGFPGVWWEHYKDEIPAGRCDAIAELDYNTYHKRYEVRLIAVRPGTSDLSIPQTFSVDWILDWRDPVPDSARTNTDDMLVMTTCPASWDELQIWLRLALREGKQLAIAYAAPATPDPIDLWQQLIGIAKYLSRTGQIATRKQLLDKLQLGDRTLQIGFRALQQLGFEIRSSDQGFQFFWQSLEAIHQSQETWETASNVFLLAIQEEQFHRQYFYKIALATIQSAASQLHQSPPAHSL
jgi:single-stranded-DNA-specific exonuclease